MLSASLILSFLRNLSLGLAGRRAAAVFFLQLACVFVSLDPVW